MSNDITATILSKEQQRREALLTADVQSLSGLLSDRLAFGHLTARYDDKQTLLDKLGSGQIVYKTLEMNDMSVVDLGSSALLFSRLTAEVMVGDRPRTIDNRTLSVWTMESGDWRLVAYQQTPIPI